MGNTVKREFLCQGKVEGAKPLQKQPLPLMQRRYSSHGEGDTGGEVDNHPVRQLAVLGKTGSIGQQTLEVELAIPPRFHIDGLAAGVNTDLLAKQIN